MTTDTFIDALENSLQALDQGLDVESCLVRYPALAEELRPILIAAVRARSLAVTEVPAGVAQRGKARVLQAAAEMREQRNAAPILPFWLKKGYSRTRFYRLAVTTALMISFLLTGGTGLVNASNGALPGDKLYPVKRSWEGVQLVFVFNPQTKVELEQKFEHERVQEIEELYSEKRMELVNFQGVVQSQQNGILVIDGLSIAIEGETVFTGEIMLGATVQVVGETDDGIIKASQIILISAPQATPTSALIVTPVPQALPGDGSDEKETPEAGQSQSSEAGEDSSGSSGVRTKDDNGSEKSGDGNESYFDSAATPRAEHFNSGSNDGGSDSNSGGGSDSGGGGSDSNSGSDSGGSGSDSSHQDDGGSSSSDDHDG
ncbi:MAG: DUF5667 domain-containing protein [Chloroflexi bacterium]|nr:DUF5667 domain-containing protein [Chloroflexota bacterium]